VLILSRADRLSVEDLPANLRDGIVASGEGINGFELPAEGVKLTDLERHLIRQALRRTQGLIRPAARLLGISYKTLQYRIRKHGLDPEAEPSGDAPRD
jgi:DNA-binding NtrC family response regulator